MLEIVFRKATLAKAECLTDRIHIVSLAKLRRKSSRINSLEGYDTLPGRDSIKHGYLALDSEKIVQSAEKKAYSRGEIAKRKGFGSGNRKHDIVNNGNYHSNYAHRMNGNIPLQYVVCTDKKGGWDSLPTKKPPSL